MDIDFAQLNFWAILLAIIFNQGFGALWYSSIMFGKKWADLLGLKQEDIDKKAAVKGLIIATILAVFNYFIIALVVTATGKSIVSGAVTGFLLALVTAFQLGTNYAYEGRSIKLYLINAFYPIICYTIGGGIIGVFS